MALDNTNISISKVANALGDNKATVGALCTSTKINEWSKWKPINSSLYTMTLNELESKKYGLSISAPAASPYILYTRIQNGESPFTYIRPQGGISSPYRLGDFRNYDHSARIPVASAVTAKYLIKKGSPNFRSKFMPIITFNSNTAIGLDDYKYLYGLRPDENLYICIVLKDGLDLYWTSGVGMAEIQWDKHPRLSKITGDTTMFYCLSTLNYDGDIRTAVVDASEKFYPIPSNSSNLNPFLVALSNDLADGTLKHSTDATLFDSHSTNSIRYDISLSSIGSLYVGGTLRNIILNIYNTQNTTGSPIASKTLDVIYTLPDESTKTYSGTIPYQNGGLQQYFSLSINNEVILNGMCMQDIIEQNN